MIVIKYGGHALPLPGTQDPVISLISRKFSENKAIVLVHGGGPQIDAELAIHGIPREMVAGYRKTTPEVFAIVQKVLSGDVLRTLVNQFISYGINAVGLSAADGGLLRVKQMRPLVNGDEVDIGFVGDIQKVDSTILRDLLRSGFLPVVSPVAVDDVGQGYNVNADIAAGAIAGALNAEEMLFMTDVSGLYRNYPDPSSVISAIKLEELRELQSTFVEGMAPKVKAAISALDAGTKRVRIIDGRDISNLENALNGHGGTVITR